MVAQPSTSAANVYAACTPAAEPLVSRLTAAPRKSGASTPVNLPTTVKASAAPSRSLSFGAPELSTIRSRSRMARQKAIRPLELSRPPLG